MKYRCLFVILMAAVLLLDAGRSSAIENSTDTSQVAATKDDVSPKRIRSEIGTKHNTKIKLVDINSAKKEELMKLPGISNAEVNKIIAGRPFGSKAWLVSRKIISIETYQAVKELIICKLSQKDIDYIMAQSAHKNTKK